jgi:hypothetical protein
VEKIWFIIIDGIKKGPFSFLDLKRNERITPDTLAWKEGFSSWRPIREIGELQDLFKDEPEPDANDDESINIKVKPCRPEENEVIALRKDPPYLNIWMIMALFLILYLLYLLLK